MYLTRLLKGLNEKIHVKCFAGCPKYKKALNECSLVFFVFVFFTLLALFSLACSGPLLLVSEPPVELPHSGHCASAFSQCSVNCSV